MIFWGTFFPLISELFTGDKASLAAPWFDRYTTPLAILLVLFTGIGPLLAWRRVSWASAKRVFLVPLAGRARWPASRSRSSPTPPHKPWALALFVFAAFALAGLGAGVLARRGGAAHAHRRLDAGGAGRRRLPQPPPLRRLHRPRRHRRAADRDRRLLQLPDQPRRRRCGRGRAPSSTAARSPTCGRPSTVDDEKLSFGAVLAGRSRTASSFDACTRAAASSGPTGAARRRRSRSFFAGEATSEVGLKAGARQRLLDRGAARHRRRAAPACGRPTRASAPASAAARARRRSAERWRR